MAPPPKKPEDYTLRVTAGPTYDLSTHVEVPINSPHLTHISSSSTAEASMDIDLTVRIQNYHRGLPRNSPSTSPYFDREPHRYNRDQYSIAMRFTPKGPSTKPPRDTSSEPAAGDDEKKKGNNEKEGIPAADLQFGNDFDHPIRNYLPPGVNTAMNILKWWIDPGLEGDAYADQPYLYGPALSSFNAVRVGRGEVDEERGGLWVEEGGSSSDEDGDVDGDENEKKGRKKKKSGKQWREEVLQGSGGVGNDPKKRQKWALKDDAKKEWVWEYGRTYAVDFYNPYIDFGKCELKLPGFGVNVLRYWDGETGLRYVLRNRVTQKPYLVILFTLYPNDMINEDGTLKPEALKATARTSGGEKEMVSEEGKEKLEGAALSEDEGPKGGVRGESAGGAGAGAGGDDDVD